MRVTQINLDDDEMPVSAQCLLTLDEMAVLYRYTGHVAPTDITTASGNGNPRWAEASSGVACCVGSFFNNFYEDGVDDVVPRFGVAEIADAKRARLSE